MLVLLCSIGFLLFASQCFRTAKAFSDLGVDDREIVELLASMSGPVSWYSLALASAIPYATNSSYVKQCTCAVYVLSNSRVCTSDVYAPRTI